MGVGVTASVGDDDLHLNAHSEPDFQTSSQGTLAQRRAQLFGGARLFDRRLNARSFFRMLKR